MTSAESLHAASALPGRTVASSDALRWRSVLARVYDEPAAADAFTTPPTPELLVVVQLRGTVDMESRHGRRWSRAEYRPGSMGMTAPGNSSTLRWRHPRDGPPQTLHLHLDVGLLRGAAHILGRAFDVEHLPDALLLDDPVVLATGQALGVALVHGAGPLYAESTAHAMAAAITERCMPAVPRRPAGRVPVLDARHVAEVVGYMEAHLADPVTLDGLAEVVHLSKYHFLRAFSRATGTTPHRYLTTLRLHRAAERLRTTDEPVSLVAALCGFPNPGRFTAAFRSRHGCSPSQYRKALRATSG